MIIGTPKEIKNMEFRVGLVPGMVPSLIRNGHRVIIEAGAGEGSSIDDEQYIEVGWEDLYGSENAYWFAEDPELAERMATRPAWLDEPGLTAPASFRDTVRFEEDLYFYRTPDYDYIDLYHWTRYVYNGDNHLLPFTLYDVDPAGDAQITWSIQGFDPGDTCVAAWSGR